MNNLVRRPIWLALFLSLSVPAMAVCPSTITDCTSKPVYYTAQAWQGLLGGPWTTVGRPTSPVTGLTGYNSTLGTYEYWTGSAWAQLPSTGTAQVITAPWTFNTGPILLPGSAPQTPTNGQMWQTSAGLFYESNGSAIGPLAPSGGVSWPATNSLVVSNGSSAPLGIAPVNGDCVLGVGGVWAAQPCPGGLVGPGPTVIGYVPQWSNTTGSALAAGLPVGVSGANTVVETTSNGQINASIIPFGTGTNQVAQGGVIAAAGPIGGATGIPVLTYNAAGQLTGVSTVAPTVTSINGVAYGASPSTNTVPVVTSANTVSYEAVPNAALANSSTTVNGQSCVLGGSCVIAASPVNLSATAVTANAQFGILPSSNYILRVLFHETAGHNVSVGIGTASGTSNVLPPQAVPASGTLTVDITAFSLGWFSASASQTLFLSSSAWGSASVNAQLDYEAGP